MKAAGGTAGFATQGSDDSYYLLTSGHCDAHDGSVWTYEQDVPLGKITASENDGDNKDAAIIRLDPSVGVPIGDVGGKYPVRDVLSHPRFRWACRSASSARSAVRLAAPSRAWRTGGRSQRLQLER